MEKFAIAACGHNTQSCHNELTATLPSVHYLAFIRMSVCVCVFVRMFLLSDNILSSPQ